MKTKKTRSEATPRNETRVQTDKIDASRVQITSVSSSNEIAHHVQTIRLGPEAIAKIK